MWPAIVSAVHLLCLGLGMSLVLLRSRAFAGPLVARADFERVLALDNASGIVALLWMGSGLYRALGSVEKGWAFYSSSPLFWVKMGLLGVAWCCETPIMLALLGWRKTLAADALPDTARVPLLRRLHHFELLATVAIVFAASLMARGVGRAPAAAGPTTQRSGAEIYAQLCATCHQADGRGLGGKLAADFVGDKGRLAKTDAQLLTSIEAGVPGTAMLGFASQLSVDERARVLAYIRATFGGK